MEAASIWFVLLIYAYWKVARDKKPKWKNREEAYREWVRRTLEHGGGIVPYGDEDELRAALGWTAEPKPSRRSYTPCPHRHKLVERLRCDPLRSLPDVLK